MAAAKKKTARNNKAKSKKTTKKTVVTASKKPNRYGPTVPSAVTARQPSKRRTKLPNVWRLTKQAAGLLWSHKQLFAGITLIYGLLNLVLVQGLASSTNVTALKNEFDQAFHGDFGQVAASITVFAQLVGSAGNGSSDTAGAYQVFLVLIVSLAIIWSLRQTQAGVTVRIRDAYYRSMYPLIPFILVLCVVGLQLLPLVIGTSLYSVVITNGIAIYAIEKIGFALIAILLALLSLYMVSSSLFALYIVTLPDMTPLKALRSARELVRGRRWTVLRKVLFLPIVLLVAAAIVMIPIIIFLTPVAQWIFFILTMFALAAVHTYMYGLYRELLHE